MKQEQLALPLLKESIAYCESVADYVSREPLEDILESEEEHIDWLETQLDLNKERRTAELSADADGLRRFVTSG